MNNSPANIGLMRILCQSKVQIQFQDNSYLSQGENSRITIDEYVYDPDKGENSGLLVNMAKGAFRLITGLIAKQNPDKYTKIQENSNH